MRDIPDDSNRADSAHDRWGLPLSGAMRELEVEIQDLPSRRWRVILVRDGRVIASRNFAENESAKPWLEQQMRAHFVWDGIGSELDGEVPAFWGSQKKSPITKTEGP